MILLVWVQLENNWCFEVSKSWQNPVPVLLPSTLRPNPGKGWSSLKGMVFLVFFMTLLRRSWDTPFLRCGAIAAHRNNLDVSVLWAKNCWFTAPVIKWFPSMITTGQSLKTLSPSTTSVHSPDFNCFGHLTNRESPACVDICAQEEWQFGLAKEGQLSGWVVWGPRYQYKDIIRYQYISIKVLPYQKSQHRDIKNEKSK